MESSDEVTGRESRKLESVYKNTDEPEEGMTVGSKRRNSASKGKPSKVKNP